MSPAIPRHGLRKHLWAKRDSSDWSEFNQLPGRYSRKTIQVVVYGLLCAFGGRLHPLLERVLISVPVFMKHKFPHLCNTIWKFINYRAIVLLPIKNVERTPVSRGHLFPWKCPHWATISGSIHIEVDTSVPIELQSTQLVSWQLYAGWLALGNDPQACSINYGH